MERIAKVLANRIKEIRKDRGITQENLAERTDLSIGSIAYMETARQWPGLESIAAIAEALEVPETALFQTTPVEIKAIPREVTPREALRVITKHFNDKAPDMDDDTAELVGLFASLNNPQIRSSILGTVRGVVTQAQSLGLDRSAHKYKKRS